MTDTTNSEYDLPLTGERFLPVFEGDIVAEHYHRYLFARQFVAGKQVLDIACGEGYGSHLLAGAAEQVIGVDIDADTVAHANRTYRRDNLRYRQGDCAAIPLPDACVDVVVSFETIEHHDQHQEMMQEIKRVLRPGGLLVISSPDKLYYSDLPKLNNPYHVKELYRDEFERLLAQYFANQAVLGQRMLYASAIVEAQPHSLVTFNQAEPTGKPGLPEAVYLLALASDGPLPPAGSSLLQYELAASDLVRERDQAIQAAQAEIQETIQRAEQDARQQIELAQAEADEATRSLRHHFQEYAALSHRNHSPRWLFKQLARCIKRWPARLRRDQHERKRIALSGYFDAAWYLEQNPGVLASGLDPLRHYQRHGAFEGRDPSPHFDTLEWLMQNPWLVEQHRNPLLHYLDHQEVARAITDGKQGDAAGVYEQLLDTAAGTRGDEYVQLGQHSLPEPSRIRAIAFYLPQFHPFEENDRWWGKGFTEWTNTSKAVPQFQGHYQPRLPGELGFYDLRLPQVQERQVELARQHGLEAFCFHYYWFSGRKRLLELPLNQYVANKNIDFPFCICWANENWTRRWDGQENDILMEQRHDPEDDIEFIEDVAPLLKDPRYLRVNGKPLLIVYRITLLPDPQRTAQVWRQYCRENGVGEIHLVVAQSFGIGDPRPYGFDAALEFPPHGVEIPTINNQVALVNPGFAGNVYRYADVVAKQLSRPEPDYTLYRGVFPAWDNEARKPGRGHIFTDSTPELYRQWLGGVCDATDRRANPDDKIVFINAWNEWAEGAYLEPDRRFGYAYLSATQQTLAHYPRDADVSHQEAKDRLAQATRRNDTAVVLHLFYPELWPEFARHLAHLKGEYDLYVTIPLHEDETNYAQLLRDVPDALLLPFPNRGRDVAPFLTVMQTLRALGYGQVCKLHAKKSLHRNDGDRWRQEFLNQLLGSDPAQALAIRDAFRNDATLGMVGPAGHWLNYQHYWGYPVSRPAHLKEVAQRLGINDEAMETLHFFAGSMFWCRPEALGAMPDLITPGQFDAELGQKDGTLAHELERLFAAACQTAGLRVSSSANLQGEPEPTRNYPYAHPSPPLHNAMEAHTSGGIPVRPEWLQRLRAWAKGVPFIRKAHSVIRGR